MMKEGICMKWNKFVLLVFVMTSLVGCQMKDTSNTNESKESFVLQVFYSTSCPHCNQLRNELLPRLKDEFNAQIIIEEYDIDHIESLKLYDSYIGLYDTNTQKWDLEGKLLNVDEEIAAYERFVPFVVVDKFYAFIGYTDELLEAYVQDVHLALQNRKLATGDVSHDRWIFKKME